MSAKKIILKKGLAKLTREICNQLYDKKGLSKVYDYANKIKLPYNLCEPCEAETPTISDTKISTCAICGSHKEI